MADEVTKKDLQSLQGYCNKQIADVKKQIADVASKAASDLDKGLSEENKITVTVNTTLKARLDAVEKQIAGLQRAIDALSAKVP